MHAKVRVVPCGEKFGISIAVISWISDKTGLFNFLWSAGSERNRYAYSPTLNIKTQTENTQKSSAQPKPAPPQPPVVHSTYRGTAIKGVLSSGRTQSGEPVLPGCYVPIDYELVGSTTNAVSRSWQLEQIYIPEKVYGRAMSGAGCLQGAAGELKQVSVAVLQLVNLLPHSAYDGGCFYGRGSLAPDFQIPLQKMDLLSLVDSFV